MEKHLTVTNESKTGVELEADKGTRVTNQVNNNLDATKALNDDEDFDNVDDELKDDENITEEEVVVEEDIDEADLDDDDDDEED